MAVRVVPYSEAWPSEFAAVRAELLAAFRDDTILIEHIGSTSVPGLCAKPVIDVLVGASSLENIEVAIPRLAAAQYEYVNKYEVEIPTRRYFVRQESRGPRVHVHAVVERSKIWNEHLTFRGALRSNTATRDAYALLKINVAYAHKNDKAAYTAAKAPFITRILDSPASSVVSEG